MLQSPFFPDFPIILPTCCNVFVSNEMRRFFRIFRWDRPRSGEYGQVDVDTW